MHISSLTSIISAVIGAFNDEAGTESSTSIPQYSFKQTRNNIFLTFYENEGQAVLCPSEARGYMTFNMIEEGTNLFASIHNDNGLYLDVVDYGNPDSFKVVIGGKPPGRLHFPMLNNTAEDLASTGVVNPSVDGVPYSFFFTTTPINYGAVQCRALWVASNSATQYGWYSADLVYIS